MTEPMLTDFRRWIYERSIPEGLEALRDWLIREAEFQVIATETIKGLSVRNREPQQLLFGQTSKTSKPKLSPKCPVCHNTHPIWQCYHFKSMIVKDRWNVAKRNRLCFRCLGHNHQGENCTRSRKCGINGCEEKHSRYLHEDIRSFSSARRKEDKEDDSGSSKDSCHNEKKCTSSQNETTTEACNTSAESQKFAVTALRTIPVKLKTTKKELVLNALLDDGSTRSYITSDVAAELGLCGPMEEISVSTMNGQVKKFQTMSVECDMESLDGTFHYRLEAYTTNRVTGNMRPFDWSRKSGMWPHLQRVKFLNPIGRPIVDVLIGVNHAYLHTALEEVHGNDGEPIARRTPLEWTCIGCVNNTNMDGNANHTCFHLINCGKVSESQTKLTQILQKFWEVDFLSDTSEEPVLTKDENKAQEIVLESMEFKEGRYQVETPWKKDPKTLPDNYNTAFKRLLSTEKRLLRDSNVGQSYSSIIQDYIKKYVTKLEQKPIDKGWYLPHFPVIRPNRSTTKTRVVFDASVQHDNIALNDIIHIGPKLQRDLFKILLRFRRFPIGLICDVAEMYLQISLDPKDRPYHRFLWRGLDQSQQPDIYEFNRLVFGINSCPFQAQVVTQEHARRNFSSFPRAAKTVLESTYMDDSMDSTSSEEEAITLYKELSAIWERAGMHARKWLSTSKQVLAEIPQDDQATEVNLNKGILPSTETLGVLWQPNEDNFTFTPFESIKSPVITKRKILSHIATFFDPHGFLSPLLIRGKILMQEIWLAGLQWDDHLEDDLYQKFNQWNQQMKQISSLKIPRCIQEKREVAERSLHFFSDASNEAYGTVVYNRAAYTDGIVTVRMVASKTRVAPLTATSIPRLELLGALLSAQMSINVQAALECNKEEIYCWTDSMAVLWWLQNQSRVLKTFVGNRIASIQRITLPEQWNYVRSEDNPADIPTRGLNTDELVKSRLWWNGPKFLLATKDEWPKKQIVKSSEAVKETCKKKAEKKRWQIDSTFMSSALGIENWRLDPRRFSNWQRLKRVRAWVNRFIENCGNPELPRTGELSVEEIQDAELQILISLQRRVFAEEVKMMQSKQSLLRAQSKLLSLNPFLDDDGLLRANSRLFNADYLAHDVKFPVILPRGEWETKLVVRSYHEKNRSCCWN